MIRGYNEISNSLLKISSYVDTVKLRAIEYLGQALI